MLFYVGSRGHHADIGGITPGSMPPDSTVVEEEGVLINNFQLVRGGRLLERETIALLSSGKYPARNVRQNLADLQAQIAANQKGVEELLKMVEHFGLDVVQAYMQHVQDNAEEAVRRVITALDRFPLRIPARQRRRHQGRDPRRPCGAHRRHRLHRHLAAVAEQLQCAQRDLHGGGAVCVPHAWSTTTSR